MGRIIHIIPFASTLIIITYTTLFIKLNPEYIINGQFNRDGSGTYEFALSLGKSSYYWNPFPINDFEKINYDCLSSCFKRATCKLALINGISRVKERIDYEHMIFSLSFSFDSINTLNEAMIKLFPDKQQKVIRYSYDHNNKFMIENNFVARQDAIFNDFIDNDTTNVKGVGIKKCLEDFKLVMNYKFMDPIRAINNRNIKIISQDYKQISITYDIYGNAANGTKKDIVAMA